MISFWTPILTALMDLLQAALPWIIAALAVVFAGIAGKRAGRKQAKTEQRAESAERYAKQRKAMDDVEDTLGSDPDAARRWLRERDGAAK